MSYKTFTHAVAITPNDGSDLAYKPLAIYIGQTGDVKVDMQGPWDTVTQTHTTNAVTFKAVPAGTVLFIRPTKIYSTGTTAAFILALN